MNENTNITINPLNVTKENYREFIAQLEAIEDTQSACDMLVTFLRQDSRVPLPLWFVETPEYMALICGRIGQFISSGDWVSPEDKAAQAVFRQPIGKGCKADCIRIAMLWPYAKAE